MLDKTRRCSAHLFPGLKSDPANVFALQVGSFQKLAAPDTRRQDGVQISLTKIEITNKKDGKVVATLTSTVSSDGK
ncbi:MAG TPA: hypothetical protein VGD41_17230, partial [Pyrinomonadaceae bacterium]